MPIIYLILLILPAVLIFAAPLRAKVWTAVGIVGAVAVAVCVAAIGVLVEGTPLTLWQGASVAFGVEAITMDRLSALFSIIISLAAVATTIYSRGYLAHYLDKKPATHFSLHYTSLVVLYVSMIGVVTAAGGFCFLFCWEMMTIASFLLIIFDADKRKTVRAALSYLVMMHIGFAALLAGFALLYARTGEATFAALGDYMSAYAPLPLFALFVVGFGMKAGMFPMHSWLPEAHPAAPSHVSSIMSGVMIKTGIYGIIRVAFALPVEFAGSAVMMPAGAVMLALGIVTGLWGIILAALQNDIKRLLAYSSMENIGIILIGVGAALIGKSNGNDTLALCGMAGALLHTINHSFFKSMLFFGAGNIYAQTHSTSCDTFGGLAKSMPVTAILFLLATVAICALPPLNGFVSEFTIYFGLLDGISGGSEVLSSACGLIGLALIGGLAVLTFSKLFGTVFLGAPRTHEVVEASEADTFSLGACAIPAAGILVVGLCPVPVFRLVAKVAAPFVPMSERGLEWFNAHSMSEAMQGVMLTAWLLVAIVVALYLLKRRAQRDRSVRMGATWGCGFTQPTPRMQYTGESFSEGLQSIASSLTKDTGKGEAVDKNEIFPSVHEFEVKHRDKVSRLMNEWWTALLAQINRRVMRLRTGNISRYVSYALLFMLIVAVLSILNLI